MTPDVHSFSLTDIVNFSLLLLEVVLKCRQCLTGQGVGLFGIQHFTRDSPASTSYFFGS